MNQELWNAFLHGQIMIRIGSNQQANKICDMAVDALPGIEGDVSWIGNDFLEYPFVVVESEEGDIIFLNGRCRPVQNGKEYSFVTYAELFAEDEPANMNLEEVL